MIDTSHKASVTAIVGATGSGKDSRMKWVLAKEKFKRLAVFDPEYEYNDFGVVVNTLPDFIRELKKPKFSVIFQPSTGEEVRKAQFDWFCQCVFGEKPEMVKAGVGGNMAVVVNELSLFTTPSWAPKAWRDVNVRGRKRGLVVFGLTQFPAQVDKAFWSSCTRLYSGRLFTPAHARVMAQQLGVKAEEIQNLPDLYYIEKVPGQGIRRGRGDYSNGKPVF